MVLKRSRIGTFHANVAAMERTALISELEAEKTEQNRCMGGVDPVGCVAAARRITELRNTLRDDSIMFAHILQQVARPLSVSRARRRASSSRF